LSVPNHGAQRCPECDGHAIGCPAPACDGKGELRGVPEYQSCRPCSACFGISVHGMNCKMQKYPMVHCEGCVQMTELYGSLKNIFMDNRNIPETALVIWNKLGCQEPSLVCQKLEEVRRGLCCTYLLGLKFYTRLIDEKSGDAKNPLKEPITFPDDWADFAVRLGNLTVPLRREETKKSRREKLTKEIGKARQAAIKAQQDKMAQPQITDYTPRLLRIKGTSKGNRRLVGCSLATDHDAPHGLFIFVPILMILMLIYLILGKPGKKRNSVSSSHRDLPAIRGKSTRQYY